MAPLNSPRSAVSTPTTSRSRTHPRTPGGGGVVASSSAPSSSSSPSKEAKAIAGVSGSAGAIGGGHLSGGEDGMDSNHAAAGGGHKEQHHKEHKPHKDKSHKEHKDKAHKDKHHKDKHHGEKHSGYEQIHEMDLKAMGLEEQDARNMLDMFRFIDTNAGGTIDHAELKSLFDLIGVDIKEHEFQDVVAEVDQDGSGEIDFAEFLQVMTRKVDMGPNVTVDSLRKAFKLFAEDCPEGNIKKSSLAAMLEEFGEVHGLGPLEQQRLLDKGLTHQMIPIGNPRSSFCEFLFRYSEYAELMLKRRVDSDTLGAAAFALGVTHSSGRSFTGNLGRGVHSKVPLASGGAAAYGGATHGGLGGSSIGGASTGSGSQGGPRGGAAAGGLAAPGRGAATAHTPRPSDVPGRPSLTNNPPSARRAVGGSILADRGGGGGKGEGDTVQAASSTPEKKEPPQQPKAPALLAPPSGGRSNKEFKRSQTRMGKAIAATQGSTDADGEQT